MVIHFSLGKIVATPFEIQVRLQGVNLTAMAEDVTCHLASLQLVANAGAVCWTLTLDSVDQLQALCQQLGIDCD